VSTRLRSSAALLAPAALCALGLLGCDPTVLVGHLPPSQSVMDATAAKPVDAGSSRADARAATADASTRDGGAALADAALAAVSWHSGAHAGNDLPLYLDFGTWRGRPLDLAHLYPDRTHGWDGIVAPGWPVDMFSPFAGRLMLSLPLYPVGQGNNQDCATGAYDAQWRKLGSFLVSAKRADSIIRLGWGVNDLSHDWRADADPADWIACFRHTVTALRATDPQLQIDWSFNPRGAPYVDSSNPFDAYPGDAYVDFIGLEAFDQYPPTHDEAAWTAKCHDATGLCTAIEFARAHHKQVGIAEWGVVGCGPDPGGDNPFFVQKMFETFAANADVMAYEAYFEDGGAEICSDLGNAGSSPLAAGKYKELFGKR
jgi:hypothetical protein